MRFQSKNVILHNSKERIIRFSPYFLQYNPRWPPCHNGGRMHSDAQLTSLSSFSLGKTNKFLLHSLVCRFAGSSSVNFVFLLLARQSKQVFFALTRASVPAHVEMMGFLGIGQVMCKWVNGSSLTFATNAAITRQRQQPYGRCYCCYRRWYCIGSCKINLTDL